MGICEEPELHPGIESTQILQDRFQPVEGLSVLKLKAGVTIPASALGQRKKSIGDSSTPASPGRLGFFEIAHVPQAFAVATLISQKLTEAVALAGVRMYCVGQAGGRPTAGIRAAV